MSKEDDLKQTIKALEYKVMGLTISNNSYAMANLNLMSVNRMKDNQIAKLQDILNNLTFKFNTSLPKLTEKEMNDLVKKLAS